MKQILLCIFLFMQILNVNAQVSSDIIFIGTSFEIPGTNKGILDGFGKFTPPQYKYTKENTTMYYFGSSSKDYKLILNHVNYKNQTKPDLVILDVYIHQMNSFNTTIIDIDEFIASKNREEIYRWALERWENKDRIWIIDRRDFYKSNPKLKEPDMMKIVQCEIWIQDIPEDILNPTE